MQLTSIGRKSELLFFQNNAIIKNHPHCIQVISPDNPGYFWGNFLIYPHAPEKSDVEKWIDEFKKLFHDFPLGHISLCWDIDQKREGEKFFTERGFEKEEFSVLVASQLKAQYPSSNDVHFFYAKTNQDWQDIIQFQIDMNDGDYTQESFLPYIKKRFKHYQNLSEQGFGHWYMAKYQGRIISDLGLYGNVEFGRFQEIKTISSMRKKGIAQNLMSYASLHQKYPLYLIHATEEGPAIRMYQTLGFEKKETLTGVYKYDRKKWNK